MDGNLDKGRGFVGVDRLHAVGEIVAHLHHFCLDRVGGIKGVGAGGLADGNGSRRPAVVVALDFIGLRAQLNPAHILDAHHRTVGIDAQGNVAELFRSLEQVLHDDRGVQPLPLHRGSTAELPGGDLHVVGLERGDNVLDGEGVVREPRRIQPDPHGVLRAEDLHLADAGHPRQHLFQVGLGIVAQVLAVHPAIFGDQVDHHQVVSCRFADGHALLLHRFRQAGHRQLQLVLDLGPGQIGIRSRLEGQLQP